MKIPQISNRTKGKIGYWIIVSFYTLVALSITALLIATVVQVPWIALVFLFFAVLGLGLYWGVNYYEDDDYND